MAFERLTTTSPSRTPEASQAEPTDLRLYSAFKAWEDFKMSYEKELAKIGQLELREVCTLANLLESHVYHAIGAGEEKKQSGVSEEKLATLVAAVSTEGNNALFIRHAEQSPPGWLSEIPRLDFRKIRMMQNPFNNQDLITNQAVAEGFSLGLVMRYLKEVSGKSIRTVSSQNMRSLEVAAVISKLTENSPYTTDDGLNCIIYKDERDEPSVTPEQFLEEIPSGFMPWNPELVDKWCKKTASGKNPSEAITESVGKAYNLGFNRSGNEIIVVITHSQQLAEVTRIAGEFNDPYKRFPELSILAPGEDGLLVLDRGIFKNGTETSIKRRKINMRRILENEGKGYDLYKARRAEHDIKEKVPFLVSPEPLTLSAKEAEEIQKIGQEVVEFMRAANKLYQTDQQARALLDTGKPDYLKGQEPNYLFVRPDLVIGENGFSLCEIETSPFGLGLAELLNRGYRNASFNTLVPQDALKNFFAQNTPPLGTIVYSQHSNQYAEQLQFLAQEIMSGENRRWQASEDLEAWEEQSHIYRAFYLHEPLSDLFLNQMVSQKPNPGEPAGITPSLTPHMEEKALLALIWDTRWEQFFREQLGTNTFEHLREVIPPTMIVGQEAFFAPGLPFEATSLEEVAQLPESKRTFVLKKSGFGEGSSWAEGVHFLHEESKAKSLTLLHAAQKDTSSLYIVQEFRRGQKRPLVYDDKKTHRLVEMQARIRLTPYFSMVEESAGQLLAIKATGCENTNYIHASSNSINTAVMAL